MSIRRLILSIVIAAAVLAACGGAPVPQAGSSPPTQSPASVKSPTAALAPSARVAPTTEAAGVVTNDATQARFHVALFAFDSPNVDVFINGTIVTNSGFVFANLPTGYVTGIVYLPPGTYRVAIVPTGKPLAQALIGPLDLPMAAGHRYTLVMDGQFNAKSLTPLLIDETEAIAKLGATPTDAVRIVVNNLVDVAGIDAQWNNTAISTNIVSGTYGAGVYPAGNAPSKVTVTGDPTRLIISASRDDSAPGTIRLYGVAGHLVGSGGMSIFPFSSQPMSNLNSIDFMQGFSGKHIQLDYKPVSFDTFLAAIKTAGLTQLLATSSPYALFAPTDAAFAALPKAQRATLLADPKALADLVRAHMSSGYYPQDSLGTTPLGYWNRTVTNLLGAKLVLRSDDSGRSINGAWIGDVAVFYVANGVRVVPTTTVVLPAAK
jgi:hypothetical protein